MTPQPDDRRDHKGLTIGAKPKKLMPDEIIPEEGDGPINQLRKSQKVALKQQHSVVMQEPQSPIIHMSPAKRQF